MNSITKTLKEGARGELAWDGELSSGTGRAPGRYPLPRDLEGLVRMPVMPQDHLNYALTWSVLYCTLLYCTVPYCIALHCTALHCTVCTPWVACSSSDL